MKRTIPTCFGILPTKRISWDTGILLALFRQSISCSQLAFFAHIRVIAGNQQITMGCIEVLRLVALTSTWTTNLASDLGFAGNKG